MTEGGDGAGRNDDARGGEMPCAELEVELALDRLEGELAAELPAHMRAFAHAYAEGKPPPPAPIRAWHDSTLELAQRACSHPLLVDRGIALLRLVGPLVIENDPAVSQIRAESPSWPALQRLAAARDAVALRRFGCRAIELMHRLAGITDPGGHVVLRAHDLPVAIQPWHVRDVALDDKALGDVWQSIAARAGVAGRLTFLRAGRVQPRAFVVEPKKQVIVVVPPMIDTPGARFAVLHELGHALVALAMRAGAPRALDEGAASYIARLVEPPSWLPSAWPSEHAGAARARRLHIAIVLDELERSLPTLPTPPSATPPWALWHDPGTQAAYVEAEAIADQLRSTLGPNPAPGHIMRALLEQRDQIDRATHI